MYGIANCDTIKKAKKWLEQNDISYTFHDYKKLGVDPEVIKQAIESSSLDTVVNKRGTTYRKLSDEQKANITTENATDLLTEHSSMIKRPIITGKNGVVVGFNEAQYKEFFNIV